MMSSFRRAQLRGSDELFRPTQPAAPGGPPAARAASLPASQPPALDRAPAGTAKPEGRLVRLTDDEVDLLADALQKMKFPTSARPSVTKPSVAEFERFEALRQKLISSQA